MIDWSVYIILCSDRSLYTGISTDVDRRFQQHCAQKGAKYFRHCQPVRIVYIEAGHSRSSASRREAAIKKLTRENKQKLLTESICNFSQKPQKNAERRPKLSYEYNLN